jgi:hypothetical protein
MADRATAAETPVAKIVVDVGKRYVVVFLCDGNGVVRDEERFRFGVELERPESWDFARAVFGMAYQMAQDKVEPPSASEG